MNSKNFAVVTGASDGIGYELSKCFAEEGFDLFIAGRDTSKLMNVAAELKSMGVEVVQTFKGDLTKIETVNELYQQIVSLGRPVDAIAINAGRGLGGRFVETKLDDEIEVMRLNVVSSVVLAKLILPKLVSQGSGRILFTGSISGTTPVPFEAVYGASKAFINSFSKALHYELKGTGVTTTVLMPDATETEFFHRAEMDDTEVGSGKKQEPAVVAKEGFDALMAGKESVFGGDAMVKFKGRVIQSVLPDKIKEQMAGERSRPGSANS